MNEGNSVAVKLVWLYYIVTKQFGLPDFFYIHEHFLFINPSQNHCNQTLFTQPSNFEELSYLIRGMTFFTKGDRKT